jgi:hypothetical protein
MLVGFLLLLSLSFSISLISPEIRDIRNGDTVDLGAMGPGQTVSLLIDPKVTSGGIYGNGGMFDEAVAKDLPRGWASQESKLYQNPLQVKISAAPDAPEGDYTALVTVIDENNGEQLGNVTFTVKMHITYDVMGFDVSPATKTVGPGQPARFAISITNKGSASDVFDVSSVGAKRWEFHKQVFVPSQSTKTIYYEIVGNEEETYGATIKIVSTSSTKIADQKNVTLTVRSGLLGDYKATDNGVIIFPIFESLMYSLAGLLSNLF